MLWPPLSLRTEVPLGQDAGWVLQLFGTWFADRNFSFTCFDAVASHGRMIMSDLLRSMRNEIIKAYFMVLTQHLSGGTKEKKEKSQPGYGPRFQPVTPGIRNTSTVRGTEEKHQVHISAALKGIELWPHSLTDPSRLAAPTAVSGTANSHSCCCLLQPPRNDERQRHCSKERTFPDHRNVKSGTPAAVQFSCLSSPI